jgi:hypothetical protein
VQPTGTLLEMVTILLRNPYSVSLEQQKSYVVIEQVNIVDKLPQKKKL